MKSKTLIALALGFFVTLHGTVLLSEAEEISGRDMADEQQINSAYQSFDLHGRLVRATNGNQIVVFSYDREDNSIEPVSSQTPAEQQSPVKSLGVTSFTDISPTNTSNKATNNWPQYHRYATHTGINNKTKIALPLEEQWASNDVGGWWYQGSPVVFEDTLYMGQNLITIPGNYSYIYALDTLTGYTKWKFQAGPFINHSPAVEKDSENNILIYFGDSSGIYGAQPPNPTYMYCLIDNGDSATLKWKSSLNGESAVSAITVGRQYVYVITDTGYWSSKDQMNLYVFDKNTGALQWTKTDIKSAAAVTEKYTNEESASNQEAILRIYVAGESLYCFDEYGNTIWRQPIYSSSHVRWDNGSVPAFYKGNIYVGSHDGNVYAFRAYDGSLVWKTDLGFEIFSSPTFHKDTLFIEANDCNLHALDVYSGSIIWSYGVDELTGGFYGWASASVSDGKVIAPLLDFSQGVSSLYVFDASASQPVVLDSVTVSNTNITECAPAIAKGAIYTTSKDDYIRKFQNPDIAPRTQVFEIEIGNEVDSSQPNTVIENEGFADVGYNLSNGISRFITRADIGSIPSDAEIVHAVYQAWQVNFVNDLGTSYSVYELLEPWDPQVVTWNTQPQFSSKGYIVERGGLTLFVADITDIVKKWHGGFRPNYGLMLKKTVEPTSLDYGGFKTDDYYSLPPYIKVWYKE
ncbi:PQQ-binding-like beta-propeller repeat protein [Thermoproteota archaeon]